VHHADSSLENSAPTHQLFTEPQLVPPYYHSVPSSNSGEGRSLGTTSRKYADPALTKKNKYMYACRKIKEWFRKAVKHFSEMKISGCSVRWKDHEARYGTSLVRNDKNIYHVSTAVESESLKARISR